MFIDQVKIFVKAGDGGDGCISFRREKYVPRGGPSGGDGGNGGGVVLKASRQLSTLVDLGYQQHYRVKRAGHGEGKDRHGKNSPDMTIRIPVGTLIRDAETEELLGDITQEGEEIRVVRGGRGGRGNAAFATPTHQAPREAEEGKPGEERWLILELKLLADVGLVGLPNAGKSTLISRISHARPKTADYPFTTLSPYLGVVSVNEASSFVVADIPGLIEGAHLGKGLGIRFLRHIERTAFLLFMVDVGQSNLDDPIQTLETLREEVSAYKSDLAEKPFAVAATKLDIQGDGSHFSQIEDYCRRKGYHFLSLSSVTGEGIQPLIYYLGERVADFRRVVGSDV